MLKALFRTTASLAFLGVAMAFLTAVSLLLFGSFLLTLPILRKSPRDRKIQAAIELSSAAVVALQAFAKRDSERPQIDADVTNV